MRSREYILILCVTGKKRQILAFTTVPHSTFALKLQNQTPIFTGPNLDRACMPEALCFTVGHAVFADGMPRWHYLIRAG